MSSKNMIYETKWKPMVTYTAKSDPACIDSHKLESSPKSYWKNVYSRQDTANPRSRQDTGSTSGNPSVSHWWLMTSASNILEKSTSSISYKYLNKTMKSKKTGKEPDTLV